VDGVLSVEKVQAETASIVRKGEEVANVTLRRGAVDGDGRPICSTGLSVSVKVHPAIEQFIKGLGNGNVKSAELYDKEWVPVRDEPGLEIYHCNPFLGNGFRLDIPGSKLEDEHGNINLSFLRIKGISLDEGVTFGVRGVYSLEKMQQLREKIARTVQGLYRDYIKTSELNVTIVMS